MLVASLVLKFHIPWANSLKEKRMVVKSLCAKIKEKFGVSVAEVDGQDIHRTAVIGIACAGSSTAQLDSVLDHIIAWAEQRSDAELVDIVREMR